MTAVDPDLFITIAFVASVLLAGLAGGALALFERRRSATASEREGVVQDVHPAVSQIRPGKEGRARDTKGDMGQVTFKC